MAQTLNLINIFQAPHSLAQPHQPLLLAVSQESPILVGCQPSMDHASGSAYLILPMDPVMDTYVNDKIDGHATIIPDHTIACLNFFGDWIPVRILRTARKKYRPGASAGGSAAWNAKAGMKSELTRFTLSAVLKVEKNGVKTGCLVRSPSLRF